MNVDARLAIPAVAAWVVLGVVLGMPDAMRPVAQSSWAITLVAVAGAILVGRQGLRGRDVLVTVTLMAALTGVLTTSAALADTVRRPELVVDAAHNHRTVDVTATLQAVSSAQGSSTVPITVTRLEVGTSQAIEIRVPMQMFGSVPGAGIGSTVHATGTLVEADAGEPAAFLFFARGSPTLVAPSPWYLDWANALRSSFLRASTQMGGDGGALLPGLAIGDTSAVSRSLDGAMKSTSLSHLTAVSGANCAIVVGLIMLGGGAVGLPRRWRVAGALAVLVAFVVLVTPDASVLRAGVMSALVLAALAGGRPVRGVPVLSLAVIVLLIIDPWLALDYGFILSVLATGGLLLLSGPLTSALSKWMPAPIAVLIAIPLAAQLACQPVLILLNPAVPVYGVVANLMSEPAAPAATVIGLLACVALVVFPPAGQLLTAVAWLPSSWIAAVARFFDELPGAGAPWLPGILGVGLMALFVLLTLLVLLRGRMRSAMVHRALSMVLAACLTVYFGALAGNGLGRIASIPTDWQIAACDVGQGDAVVVRSAGDFALIDTGREPALLAKCLKDLGVTHLNLLVLTHYDLDHVGGTAAVLGMVDRAIVGPVSDASDTALRDSVAAAGARVDQVGRGTTGRLGELTWEVLWPPARPGSVEPGNPASVTVAFDGVGACEQGCLSSIFLGDLGRESQLRMLGLAKPGMVDVVKVAHHGSADQSEQLYERLQAKVGVIGVGADNGYGHPTDELLGILKQVGTRVTRSDLEGLVLLSPDRQGSVRVWMERTPERDVGTH